MEHGSYLSDKLCLAVIPHLPNHRCWCCKHWDNFEEPTYSKFAADSTEEELIDDPENTAVGMCFEYEGFCHCNPPFMPSDGIVAERRIGDISDHYRGVWPSTQWHDHCGRFDLTTDEYRFRNIFGEETS